MIIQISKCTDHPSGGRMIPKFPKLIWSNSYACESMGDVSDLICPPCILISRTEDTNLGKILLDKFVAVELYKCCSYFIQPDIKLYI